MRLNIDVTMEYQLEDPMVFLTIEAADTDGQIVIDQQLDVQNATLSWVDGEEGLGQRVWARVGGEVMRLHYRALVDVTRSDIPLAGLQAAARETLPGSVITFLRPSRFCQSDLFTSFVDRQFGYLDGGDKIAAIRDWVADEMTYVPGSSHAGTTVLDTFAAREGVCRDYAHMVCALARAADIPARYAAVYGLGVTPPDFHAVAQVWLDGAWHLVDSTRMCTPEDLVVIAVGRDACDIAFMETGAFANMVAQDVSVIAVPEG
ncbi:transglutaminase family protein [Pseudooceanicola sediminis]|uniref:Transglutaminase family protein n=1 Tax=Pseudooceanicola sediminis TaxID=2211117 RepID=A0A399J4I4_9RHOB|nr:transglutaminase family protein [Pseudooceanicola sediminis]KAA2315552.1 transglutaminase family protein [Puniceibacterium sp. HSS470]RII40244.1 transglutaminase family protein [Pseudooceanicola sediminis]|tara:strand:+ start:34553 stop:35335 length:783 start_codon:yes stop_codon:yes gene_type:complete